MCHDPCSLFLSWPSQVVFAKLSHHSSAELVHSLNGSRLTHAKVVVLCIGRCSVCKHPHGGGALLNRREPDIAYRVMLELEVGVELSNAVEDIHEQNLAHPISAMKFVGMCCVICELVVVQHGMPLHPLLGLDVNARFYSCRQCWASKSRGL